MKPVYKGITTVALATGATMLAITLLSCSKSEDEGKADTSSALSAGSPSGSVQSDVSDIAPEEKQQDVSEAHAVVPEQEASSTTAIMPPPPGLFQTHSGGIRDQQQAAAPAAPEAPRSPQTPAPLSDEPGQPKAVVVESTSPVAPESAAAPVAPQEVKSPAAPQALTSEVKPAGKAKPAQAPAVTIPPPPMPKIEDFRAHSAQAGEEPAVMTAPDSPGAPARVQAKVKVPEAPRLEVHNMPGNDKQPQVAPDVSASAGRGGAVSMPEKTSMQMPAPAMNMRMPSPGMNMGEPAMNQGMNPGAMYAPRVYFVPMPMYPYGQPYMPSYGYPVPNGAQQAPSIPQQSGKGHNK